jgi:glycosyltransferase involved in cell wall biosynthesis
MNTLVLRQTRVYREYKVAGSIIGGILLVLMSWLFPHHGIELAALILLVVALVAVALHPKRALFIYIVALPLHNFLMALLFRTTGDITFVKLMQPWKELILAVALVRVGVPAVRDWLHVRRWRLTALDVIILLFMVLCALSVVLPSHAINLTGRIYGFRELVLPMSLYFLGRLLPLNRRDMRLLVGLLAFDVLAFSLVTIVERVFWGSALFVAMDYGIYNQLFFGTSSYLPYNIPTTFFTGSPFWLPRAGSLALNPLDLATLLLIALPVLLAVKGAMRGRAERRDIPRLGPAIFSGGMALALAFGRASLLLLPVECILLLLWGGWRRFWRGVALAAVGCILGGLLLAVTASYVLQVSDSSMRVARSTAGLVSLVTTIQPGGLQANPLRGAKDLFQESTSSNNPSTQGHLASYKKLTPLILEHPLGYGIGSSGFVGFRFHTDLEAESAYLPVGIELGIVGLLLFLAAYTGSIYACWGAARARGDTLERSVFMGMALAWVFLALDSVVTEVTLNFFVMYLLWWMAGAGITQMRQSRLVPAPATSTDGVPYRAVRPLRVAMDVQCLKTARTGVRTYVNELLKQFARPDAPHIVVPVRGPVRLPNSRRLFRMINQVVHLIWLHCWLPVELAIGNYDVLFSPEYLTPIWVPVARVVTYHASSFLRRPEDYNRLWRLMFRRVTLPAIRRADAVIVPSRYVADEGIKFARLNPERIRVTLLGGPEMAMEVDEQDAVTILARYGVTPRSYVLHVGVLERRKNLVTLVKAFAIWRRQGAPAHFKLVLVGQAGPRPDLDDSAAIRRAIAAFGLDDCVVLTGHLSLVERDAFYTHAAVVAIPSLLEGFGIPVLEAFAAQVPVVCSRAGALPEVAGNAALLFDPDSPQELAACLARLEAEPALRAALVQAGSERLRCFTWERTVEATYQAFEDACVHAYAPVFTVPSLAGQA